jgi:hypothetical protein
MDIRRRDNVITPSSPDYNTDVSNCFAENATDSSDQIEYRRDDSENSDNMLRIIAEIGARENAICPRALQVLASTCKDINNSVQWRLDRMKSLRQKYMREFGLKLHKRLINHPIEYTRQHVKVTSVGDMGYDNLGVRILDLSAGIVSEEFATGHRLAFTNICLLAREPKPFVCVLMLRNHAVIAVEYTTDDYIDTGKLTDSEIEHANKKYGTDPQLHPGRYLIDLNLKTKINPILLNEPFIKLIDVRLVIAENYSTYFDAEGNPTTNVEFDGMFIADTFTHAMIHFKSTPADAYNWSEYVLTFNQMVNQHAVTASFIRRRTDLRVDMTPAQRFPLAPSPMPAEYLRLIQRIVAEFTAHQNGQSG